MQHVRPSMPKGPDLTGQRFGRLIVIAYKGQNQRKNSVWTCKCDCGGETDTTTRCLRSGDSKSCGCLRRENAVRVSTRHGMSRSPEYTAYRHMIDRCTRPGHKHFSYYGGRGIYVCERWLQSFEYFFEDMGKRPKGASLERIDVNDDYTPENCRWALAWKEQMQNKRNNVFVLHDGKTQCVTEWARQLGVPKSTALARLHRGLPFEHVFAGRTP